MNNIAHSLQIRCLAACTTIESGPCCDLKVRDDAGTRWWLCRMPPGHTSHRIIIETCDPETGAYVTTQTFIDEEPA